ncbi:Beta-lactamase [Labilithrix luteola]|uniref:Beta-lactamase n=1 Tax=Labilithrix luteola TaxID=1391654 RepID=A0A0K1QEH3_9BACT|nr:serine hydrolase domain-containing protein [Labilithrix luteola]AKV04159.1 Beta-lactamase [Labilithrix luteola]
MNRLWLVAFAALAPLVLGACRAKSDSSARHDAATIPSATSRANTNARLAAMRSSARVPGAAYALVCHDGVLEAGGDGVRDTSVDAASNTVTADTLFEVASIAKPIVATCVMQLAEAKRLDLDADASIYLPFRLRSPHAPNVVITLRMLLAHVASIVDPEGPLAHEPRTTPLARHLEEVFLGGKHHPRTEAFSAAAPGTAMRYSNVGVSLAALAVERASGEPFSHYAEAHVFVPLRMKHATYEAPPSDAAVPHRGTTPLPRPSHALYPIVDLHASADDLGRFAQAILRGGELDGARILSATSVEEMLRPPFPAVAPDQALGWQLRTFGERATAGHEGEDQGASTAMFLDRTAGAAAIVLTNGDAFTSGEASRSTALGSFLTNLLRTPACPAATR